MMVSGASVPLINLLHASPRPSRITELLSCAKLQ